MLSRSIRLGLLIVLGTVLLASSSFAQGGPGRRGPLQVLGLRAPDGDDEAATTATTALRQAARDVGFAVPDDSPSLEQEIALFSCDISVPPACLAQIAGDIHAAPGTKMLYGSVQRTGRGAAASLVIEIGMWDQALQRVTGHEQTSIERARSRDSDAIRQLAGRLVASLAGPDPGASATPVAPTGPAVGAGTLPGPGPVVPEGPHTLRWIGVGVFAVGIVAGVIGVVEWAQTNSQNSTSLQDPQWLTYQPNLRSGGDVCNAASNDTSGSAQASHVRDLCSSNSTSQALAFGLGIGGAVVAAAGAVLFFLDHGAPAAEARPAATQPVASRIRVTPMISPQAGGLNFGLTF